MNFSIFVCLVLGAEWRGLKPECGWLPGPLWLRLAQAVARWPEPWTGPGQSWSVSHSQGWPAGWLRLRAGSSLCQQGSQSLRLRSERRRSEPGSPPPRSPPDQCNKLMCTPHSGWAQAGMAWGEGRQRLVSVVILARVTAAGILFKSKPSYWLSKHSVQ